MTTIDIDHTSRWFGNVVAVNDVTMTVGPGVTGLLGPNGAGKSTLINMMGGFLAPSTGTVTLDGEQIWRNESVYKKIGIVPEREAMYDFLTGREFVVANAELHGLGAREAGQALATVEMEYAQDRKIQTYSKACASASRWPPPSSTIRRCCSWTSRSTAWTRASACNSWSCCGGWEPRTHGPVLLAHPRRGRAARLAHRGHRCRTARGQRRLPQDPPPDDGPAAPLSDPLQRRPRLAAALIADPSTAGIEVDLKEGALRIQAVDFGRFTTLLPQVAKANGIRLLTVSPSDESLESVFSYLVAA